MITKDFDTVEEADAYIMALADSSVDAYVTKDGKYRVSCVANKKFTSIDGKEYTDEVWVKEDGTMIHCQDLELEHAKNIIRMMLRSRKAEMEVMLNHLENITDEGSGYATPVYH